jgi:hypothetical protein
MTVQIKDSMEYRGRLFRIASVSGGPLFEPQAHGLKPHMIHTGCWRGFDCTFAVEAELAVYLDYVTDKYALP